MNRLTTCGVFAFLALVLLGCGGGGDTPADTDDGPGGNAEPQATGRITGTIRVSVPEHESVVEAEPNDSFDQSHFLGDLRRGRTLTIFGHATSDETDPFDGFRFFAPERVLITARLEFNDDDQNDFDVAVYDYVAGDFMERFLATTSPDEGEFAAKGQFALVVSAAAGEGDYILTIAAEKMPTFLAEEEPNSEFRTGTYFGELAAGDRVTMSGHAFPSDPDSLHFTTRGEVQLDIRLTQPDSARIDALVYDISHDLEEPQLLGAFSPDPDDTVLRAELTVPGGRWIQVMASAVAGSGDYYLTVLGEEPPAPAEQGGGGESEATFVPSSAEDFWQGKPTARVGTRARFGDPAAPLVAGQALVCAKAGSEQAMAASLAAAGCREIARIPGHAFCVEFDVPAGLTPREQQRFTACKMLELSRCQATAYAEPNYLRQPLLEPNDEFYNLQWHYEALNLPAAWEVTTGSADVIVAVIDTGSRTHPDLDSRIIGGYDFISNTSISRDGDGRDSDYTDEGDRSQPNGRSSWHGTHVAGTIGAVSDNDEGVAGVTWETGLMILRALGQGGGTTFDIANAIRYAAGLDNGSGKTPQLRANVINMSLGGGGFSNTMNDACQAAIDEGVVICASSGNSGSKATSYPASYDRVLSIGSTDVNNKRAWYSTWGPNLDFMAPGGDMGADKNADGNPDGVLSTHQNEPTVGVPVPAENYLQGTSMASPHAAGVVALMFAVAPDITPAEVETVLRDTALDLGAEGRDNTFGYGLIDAHAAVIKANPDFGLLPARVVVSNSSLLFERLDKKDSVRVRNAGELFLTVDEIEVKTSNGGAWLSAVGALNDDPEPTSDIKELDISVNRSGLDDGTYFGRIILHTNGGDVTIQVVMIAQESPPLPPNFNIFVRLVNMETDEIAGTFVVNPATGLEFDFTEIADGTYRLEAGTDDDGDGIICEAGELCGVYPIASSPVPIRMSADEERTGLNFTVTPAGTLSGG